MRHVPAWPGEFGLKVYSYVPQVHTVCLESPTPVEIEEGEEALFPAAEYYMVAERVDDSERHGAPPDLGVEPTRFVPEPHVSQLAQSPDIVVCPRWREYGSEKNWEGWNKLTSDLRLDGYEVHAAGAPDSSKPTPCLRAWDYDRFLDASIEMMLEADLVVATDAGLAHLAVLCGADLLVVTYEGRVAPGPVIDSQGNIAREAYWTAGWGPDEDCNRFEDANHRGARIEYVDGWEDVSRVTQAVEDW